jgi:hypothetical protein
MPASTAKRTETAQRRAAAVAMKIGGASFEEIAERIPAYKGNAKTASKDLWRAMKAAEKLQADKVNELRQIQAARLERMHAEVWPMVTNDLHCEDCEHGRIDPTAKLRAIETGLKIGAEYRKLHGLDRPTVTQITGPDGGRLELEVPQLNELQKLIQAAGDQPPVDQTPQAPVPGEDAGGQEG